LNGGGGGYLNSMKNPLSIQAITSTTSSIRSRNDDMHANRQLPINQNLSSIKESDATSHLIKGLDQIKKSIEK
jgi:hypothetical protein